MIVLELFHREYDRASATFVSVPDAVIEVEGEDLRVVEGDPGWDAIREIAVDDPERPDRTLMFEDDPERWALAVPAAFRGDTVATAKALAAPARAAQAARATW